jgi:FixJ family two-component response regulator
MSAQCCVFIIDDDYAIRDCLGLVVEAAGFACQVFENAEEFLKVDCPTQDCCLLLDVNLPGLNGLELQALLIHKQIQLPIIFLTGNGNPPTADKAIQAGAFDFLNKPVSSKVLIERITAALQ